MTFNPAESFNRHFDAALAATTSQSGMPVAHWFSAGRRNPSQNVEDWRELGPQLVQKYIDWYEASPDINIWITPDGKPAIELDLTVMFGEVEVHCIIDQVVMAGTALMPIDLKSGSQQPENLQQLGIYACAIELAYGVRPKYGSYFMHRLDRPLAPVELSGYQYSIEFLTGQFARLDRGIQSGVFVAKPGKQCERCGVASACPAMGVRPKMVSQYREAS